MLAVEQALELVAKHAFPLAPQRVLLAAAAGLVLAEDVTSEVNSPPYDKSMMDGYAVRSGDRELERRVLEEIAAGDVPHRPVTPGMASRIMTGAPLPEGADAVVPVEQTELADSGTVRLRQTALEPGQNVLPLGTALRAGDVVLRDGSLVRPIEIAILAEIGHAVVAVRPRPRIAILTTGNELVAVDEKPLGGQIRNSNGPMLVAAANRLGAETIPLGIARDEQDELRRWIEQGLAADVLVLSGGVSAGKFDLVPAVLAELGVERVFHKIALRPGKPMWFGVRRDGERQTLVFGLPGNPMSSFVCFELFVRPALAALAGRGFTGAPCIEAELSHDYDHPGGRAACLPALVTSAAGNPDLFATNFDTANCSTPPRAKQHRLEILPWHGSADLAAVARANGLARLPAEKRHFPSGSTLSVLLL